MNKSAYAVPELKVSRKLSQRDLSAMAWVRAEVQLPLSLKLTWFILNYLGGEAGAKDYGSPSSLPS